MELAQPTIKGEAGQSADEQSGRIDEVCGEVQHFALLGLAWREHIFDVLEMSSRSKVDEESGESNEGDLKEHREARKCIIDAQTAHAPS